MKIKKLLLATGCWLSARGSPRRIRPLAKRIRLFCLFLFVGGLATGVFAQQLPLFSQYMLNDYFQNTAVAGSRSYFNATSATRLQWLGITDAPRTYALSMNGPIKAKNMGVGGYLFTDVMGPTRKTGLSGSYAYHIQLKEKIKISLSLSAGLLQYAVDASKLTLNNQSDYVFNNYQSRTVPDLGASFYLYAPHPSLPSPNGEGTGARWYVGGSVPQIFQAKLKLFEVPEPKGKLATHFYATGGYKLFLTEQFSAEPSLLVKFVSPAPVQIDIAARIFYKNKIWLGGTYRTQDAISAMAGYIYKENIIFGYSYDITTTNLKNYNSGTHELMISLRFNVPQPASTPKVE